MNRTAYLIFVSGAKNHNKFYRMEELPSGKIKVTWGRVESAGQEKIYDDKSWHQLLQSKLNKGYQDITALKVTDGYDLKPLADAKTEAFFSWLQAQAKGFVKRTYTADLDTITQAQVEKAQSLLDNLRSLAQGKTSLFVVNKQLEAIWSTIPRKMKNVADEYLTSWDQLKGKIEAEQKTLDILAAQVGSNPTKSGQTLADVLGIKLLPVSPEELEKVAEKCSFGRGNDGYIRDHQGNKKAKIVNVYKVEAGNRADFETFVAARPKRQQRTRLLFHGSRNENWWNIAKTGLKLRPNATITGKLFGYGLYFAEDPMKASGYTSLKSINRWVGGQDKKAVISLFEVHTGFELRMGPGTSTPKLQPWINSLTEPSLKTHRDYDSVNAQRGFDYGGSSLLNSEQIVYNEKQASLRFLIEIEAV